MLPFTVNDIEPRFGSVKEMVAYIKKGAAGGTRGRSVSKDTIQTLMNCMMKLEMGPHLQRSSNTTSEPTSDTTKVSKSSWMSSVENKIENQKGLSWRPSSTSASLGLESPIDATTTRTTENPDTSSRRKLPAKFSLTGTMVSGASGLMNSVGQPYRLHCSYESSTSGTTESRLREVQSLTVVIGRSLSQLRLIQLTGGGRVLNIWKTPDNSGEDSPEFTISQRSQEDSVYQSSSSTQKVSTTQSPQRLTQRQPQNWSERKLRGEDQRPWHWPNDSDWEMEEQMMPEPVSLSDLPPLPDLSQILPDTIPIQETSMDGLTPSTDDDSLESVILPRDWRNVQPRDVGTTTYT